MLGRWDHLSLDELQAAFRGAAFRWYVAGGYALELATGRSWRAHDDIDVGVCRRELRELFHHLADWELYIAAAGRLRRWDGRPLDVEQHENNIWARRGAGLPWVFDVVVGGGDDEAWWSRRDPSVRLPWGEAVELDPASTPYLAPHVQLLVKATSARSKDDEDAREVVPHLSAERRRWLGARLPDGHGWRPLCRG